jgi:hypothetical protein
MKKGKLRNEDPDGTDEVNDIPDGIIEHLTATCGGNVTSGSFEQETYGVSPDSGAYDDSPDTAARNVADLETHSCFISTYRDPEEDLLHTKNN